MGCEAACSCARAGRRMVSRHLSEASVSTLAVPIPRSVCTRWHCAITSRANMRLRRKRQGRQFAHTPGIRCRVVGSLPPSANSVGPKKRKRRSGRPSPWHQPSSKGMPPTGCRGCDRKTTPIFSTAGARPVGERSKRRSSQWDPQPIATPHTRPTVNRTYLSKLEKVASYPGLKIIARLATLLAVEPAELLRIARPCGPRGIVISRLLGASTSKRHAR